MNHTITMRTLLFLVIGQNMPATETCTLAVIAAINYHQRRKHENNDVRL